MANPSNTVQNRLQQKREREEAHRVWLDALLNERDVARITGLFVASVRRWRLLRQGPKYLKIGAAVRYKPEDISAWLESRRIRRHRKFPQNPIWTQLALAVLKVAVYWILRAN